MITSMLRRAQLSGGCAATAEPNVVTGLTATPSGTTTINLVWDADSTAPPNQVSSYDIERSNDGSTGWSVIATVAAPAVSYGDTTLSASTTRHYRIVSKNCADVANASTSASATTAAGSIGPSWSLDFSSGTPSGYTLTRASTGTYVDSSGYIASASTNVARLTHDKNGARLGLLIEESRANILTRSEDFATGWAGGNTNVVVNDTAAPDNATTADKIAANTTTGAHWRRLGATSPVAGTTYVFSCFFKTGAGNATHAILSIETTGTDRSYTAKYDTSTGARTDTDSSGTPVNTDSPTQAEDMGNGWWRAWVRIEHSTGNTGLRAYVGLSNAATGIAFPSWTGAAGDADFIYFWGTQVEASTNVPTAYIPTTTSSVTRSADLVHVLDSAITSWGDPGAIVLHFYAPSQAGTLISTDDAATAQVGIQASTATDVRAFWSSGSTAAETMTTGVQKAVHYWNGSTSKLCLNGGPVRSGSNNFTIANTDFVTLGAEATDSAGVPGTFSQYANCVIRKVEFYSGTLTDSNLQTITT
jgi:hypothetical protein